MVFGVSDLVRYKTGCTATEDCYRLEIEGLYYPCSEKKGADQLRGNREADLRLFFRICKKPVFLITRLLYFSFLPQNLGTRTQELCFDHV